MERREGHVEVAGTKLYFREKGNGQPVIVIDGGPGMDHTSFFLSSMS